MRQPRGIAIHQDNLYVTDIGAHSIFQFKIESAMHFIAKLGSQGFDLGQFNAPRGLTVSTNGDVFVADYGNNRIQILDGSLNYQRSLIDQTMKYPLDVKLTPDGVYVLFFGSACITRLSIQSNRAIFGQWTIQISSIDYSDGNPKEIDNPKYHRLFFDCFFDCFFDFR